METNSTTERLLRYDEVKGAATMASVTLEIPPELEKKLRVRAIEQGRDIASLSLDLIEQGLRRETKTPTASELTPEERFAAFQEWAKDRPMVDVVLDVSRESIYEGCGE